MRSAVQMIGDDQPGREIVAAVEHEVGAGEQRGGIGRRSSRCPRLREAHVRIEPRDRLAGDLGLGPADVGGAEQDLALEIVERDDVVVDHPERADAGGGEILDGRRADAAGADERDARREQLALALAANLLEDDVAGVAVELGVAEGHRPVEPKPPAPRAVVVQVVDFAKAGPQHRRRHQLGDALAADDLERLGAEIGEDHLHLAAIVAVDRAGRVEAGDAVLEGEARARPDLDLVAVREWRWRSRWRPRGARPGRASGSRRRRRRGRPRARWRRRGGEGPRRAAAASPLSRSSRLSIR